MFHQTYVFQLNFILLKIEILLQVLLNGALSRWEMDFNLSVKDKWEEAKHQRKERMETMVKRFLQIEKEVNRINLMIIL
jgi:hypothetical protein